MAVSTPIVLLITTNETMASTLQKRFSQYGYFTLITKHTLAALEQSQKATPEIILVDRHQFIDNLPTVIETLWRNPALKQVPVVTVLNPQASCEEEECLRDLESGFDAYLCNVSSHQIVAYARAILRTLQKTRSPKALRIVGQLRMDVARHEVHVGDRIIDLTNREFMILKVFMDNPGVVLTREQFLNHVWGEDALEEHALAVHIHSLRQKIERSPSKPSIIITVRSVGYKLQAGTVEPLPPADPIGRKYLSQVQSRRIGPV